MSVVCSVSKISMSTHAFWNKSHAILVRLLFTRVCYNAQIKLQCYYSGDVNNKLVNSQLVNIITKCFNCTPDEAETFCAKLPQRKFRLEIAENHLKFLKNAGIDVQSLFNNSWLLYQSSSSISRRIALLKGIGLGVNHDTIPLIKLSNARLGKAIKQWHLDEKMLKHTDFENRLIFFSRHLNCTVAEIAAAMPTHYPLLTLDFCRIKRVLQSLLQYNIQPEDILKDLWIFRHNEGLIMDRLYRAAAEGVQPIKTWMLRCPERVFANYLQKWTATKDVLGDHEDHVSYLAERLQCDKEGVMQLSRRYPKLLTIKLLKVKQMLDFVYSKGFTPSNVYLAPRVLSHSITTLQTRLEELNKLGYKPNTLNVLFCNAKIYEQLKIKLRSAQKT